MYNILLSGAQNKVPQHILLYLSLPFHSSSHLLQLKTQAQRSPTRALTSLTVTPQGELPFKQDTGAKR